MKKLVLLLSLGLALNASNIYDEKTIRDDFSKGNKGNYYNENIPLITKETAKKQYLKEFGDGSTLASIPDCSTSSALEVFKCPAGSEALGYSTSLYDVNYENQTMTCLVAKKDFLEKPVAIFKWNLQDYGNNNSDCANYFTRDVETAARNNIDLINNAKAEFSGLEAARVIASEASYIAGANTNVPNILVGVLLGDTDLIDIQSSINHNSVVLQKGFKPKGGNFLKVKAATTVKSSDATFKDVMSVSMEDAGGSFAWAVNLAKKNGAWAFSKLGIDYNPDIVAKKIVNTIYKNQDKSSDVITSRMVTMLEFYPKFSMLNQSFYMLMLGVFSLVGLLIFGSTKIAERLNEGGNNINSSTAAWIGGIVLTGVLFLPSEEASISIAGEDYKLSQNNFNTFEKVGYYTALDFADSIAKIVIDGEMNSIIRRAGMVNTGSIAETAAHQELITKQLHAVSQMRAECENIYNINHAKRYSDSRDYIFPSSEQYMFASMISKGFAPKYYNGEAKGGLVKKDLDGKYPAISLSGCKKTKLHEQYLHKLFEKNKSLLEKATVSVGPQKIAQIEALMQSQYAMYEEWGYMSVLGLATTVYKSESLGTLLDQESGKDSASMLLKEDIGEDELKQFLKNVPYFMLPAVNSIYNIVSQNSGKIGSWLGASAGSIIPGGGTVTGAVGGAVGGFIAGPYLGYKAAVMFAKDMLEMIPIAGIVLFGLLINLKIIVKIFTYHLMSPFVLLLAFAKQNISILLNFSSRVITIMLELPIFVLSIFAAMASRDILLAIGTPLSSTVLKLMLESTDSQGEEISIIDNAKDYIFQGIFEVGLSVFSFIIIYKILSTYHTQIFEAIEAKTASAFDNSVDSAMQSAQGWGHRV